MVDGSAVPDKIEKVSVNLGMVPTTIEEGWRLASMMAKSDLVPKGFKGKPEDILVAIQMGAELGLAPMQSLQSIAVINGRPGVWGDGLLAIIVSSPLYVSCDEFYEVNGKRAAALSPDDLKLDNTTAVCTMRRRGVLDSKTYRFSIADAKKAHLWVKPGPWQEYPARMLQMRARSFCARDLFPDLTRGIRSAEELRDIPPMDDHALAPAKVMRLSEAPPPEPEPEPES